MSSRISHLYNEHIFPSWHASCLLILEFKELAKLRKFWVHLFFKLKTCFQEEGREFRQVLLPHPPVNQPLQSFPQQFSACVKSDSGDVISLEQEGTSFSEGPWVLGTLVDAHISSTDDVGIFRQSNWRQN